MSAEARPTAWRGLQDAPAPLLPDAAAQRRYRAALAAAGSNPAHPHFDHAVSLLVTDAQLAEQLLGRRAALRQELGEAAWVRCRECFVNKRDAPLQLPAGSTPVLSQYTLDGGDLAVPAVEDYERCWPGAHFGRGAPGRALPAPPPWEARRATAVFRGGATGAGVLPETNPRLRLVQLAHAWRRGGQGQFLDAELTSWNLRQKLGADGVLRLLDPAELRRQGIDSCGRQHYLTWEQQAEFKYAVYLPGNVGASRLGALLGLGFVILAPEPTGPALGLWRQLEADVHYLRLEPDFSDLRKKLQWLRYHDADARRLSAAAQALAQRELSRSALEAAAAAALAALPPPDDARLVRSLEYVWTQCRAAVYALVDGRGRLRLFVPFANQSFHNGWPAPPPCEPAPLEAFLACVRHRTQERDHLPWQRWWTNGGLVCNVLPADVWGESMLPALQLLLERAARLLVAPQERLPSPSFAHDVSPLGGADAAPEAPAPAPKLPAGRRARARAA